MLALRIALALLALYGHVAFWVAVVNRWHAIGLPRSVIKAVTLIFYAGLLAPLAWLAWQVLRLGGLELLETPWQTMPLNVYGALAAGFGAFHLAVSIRQRLRRDLDDRQVTSREPRVVDLAQVLGSPPLCGPRAKLLARVPGNQLCHLQLNESTLTMPGLAGALHGLSICHLSDLHFSGRLDRGYYREMVRLANDSPADLLALTGDICDLAACIAWVPELLGPLQARLGKYYILGNHDLRTHDVGRLRGAMREAGFVDLGGVRRSSPTLASWSPGMSGLGLPANRFSTASRRATAH